MVRAWVNRRLLFERAMHPLMGTVVFGMAWAAEKWSDSVLHQTDAQGREAAFPGSAERHAVVAVHRLGQAMLTEQSGKRAPGLLKRDPVKSIAGQQIATVVSATTAPRNHQNTEFRAAFDERRFPAGARGAFGARGVAQPFSISIDIPSVSMPSQIATSRSPTEADPRPERADGGHIFASRFYVRYHPDQSH